MVSYVRWILLGIGTIAAVGCRPSDDPVPERPANAYSATDYATSTRPPDAVGVIEAREEAEDGRPITVTGRIGGSADPWVQGRAAFTLVDLSLKPCNATDDDQCPTPWDYCCESQLARACVLVKLVDDNDQVLAADARGLLGLKELYELVVCGTARRDDAGNVSILARKIYVQRE